MSLQCGLQTTTLIMRSVLLLHYMANLLLPCHAQVLVEFAREFETSLLKTRIPDAKQFLQVYDFIIIGAGSAGCVVANRLSEDANVTILLLEAGDQETFLSDVPLTAALTQMTRYNWGYKSEPTRNACRGLKGGVCNWPKGRGVGGTSLINFMLYTRGHPRDYDHWAALGNIGWSYDKVLPYFKKSENIGIPELVNSPYHGHSGTLDVQYTSYCSRLMKHFLLAGLELGYNITDPNSASTMGFSRAQANIRAGRRCSTSKAFIRPIIGRKNLHISMKSWVTKIRIHPRTKVALGVEFIKNRKRYVINARKEVIVSAGAIASPQLLMLSGVGPRSNLQKFDIPVIQELKVGYNLQDHVTLNGLVFLVNDTTVNDRRALNPLHVFKYAFAGQGLYTIPGGAEAFAFIRTPNSTLASDYADIEIVLGAGSLSGDTLGSMRDLLGLTDEFFHKVYAGLENEETFGLVPVLLRPKSRGRISLQSASPFRWPKMEPNYMDDADDIRAMIEGIQFILQLIDTRSMQKLNTKFHKTPLLGCENEYFGSLRYWKCCLRLYGSSLQHQAGTCKMGPKNDAEAVVDAKLRVYGIKNLRVADASIMPTIPAGHTNAVVIMIAEKAADMIRKTWGTNS